MTGPDPEESRRTWVGFFFSSEMTLRCERVNVTGPACDVYDVTAVSGPNSAYVVSFASIRPVTPYTQLTLSRVG